ncbi:MAG: FAD-binding oxidoreductase [Alphaproteobacteria bacterium]|nr:FAD-binding oxidoreductase [Alphaproteobacteria bacterium]
MTDRAKLRWNAWGTAGHQEHLAAAKPLWTFLGDALCVGPLPQTPAKTLAESTLAPSRLAFGDVAPFQQAGCEISSSAEDRAFHARGDSYRDLLDLRAGRLDPLPDAVLYPRTRDACLKAIEAAARLDIAVVPFGGGTSVVGGVAPLAGRHRAVVAIDTTRLDQVLAIDRMSMTATAEAGIHGPALEQRLNAEGVTLGHYPQSFEFSTLGGWIAARGAGQQSNRYGKAEHWLVSARLATPGGLWSTEGYPASAAGPRLTDLVAGSEGTLGLITDATVALHAAPEARDYRAFLFHDFAAGREAIREIVQADIPACSLRLSDEDETHFYGVLGRLQREPKFKDRLQDFYLKRRGFDGRRCALIAGAEGDRASVRFAHAHVAAIARRHGALAAGSGPAESWYKGRFHGPYLRDPMLDRGLGVDTLETATHWSNVAALHGAVRRALLDAMQAHSNGKGICLAHVSHSYRDGASLYFTYVWPRATGGLDAEIAQWTAIKKAASDAIAAYHGTISHHHGAGTDHAAWLPAEKGATGMNVLRALKSALDPTGIMNPGKMGL